tara:strand:+ start:328 stop:1452 length:1125 start_codon:yes stop_codon:yes gene_type:complete
LWWTSKQDDLIEIAADGCDKIVYNKQSIIDSIKKLKQISSIDRLFYAMKANYNPSILNLIYENGIGFECVSPGEVKHLIKSIPGIDLNRIIFTPNFAPKSDYIFAIENNLNLTIDNIFPFEEWPDLFIDRDVFVRVDPGIGDGHHEHVVTGGNFSKFGIPISDIARVNEYSKKYNINIKGLHSHNGSGIKDISSWINTANILLEIANKFPSIKIINLGGGIPIKEKLNEDNFDFNKFQDSLNKIKKDFLDYEMWLEPGRYIVGESGVILSHVTQTKKKQKHFYIGLGIGMNVLIRPPLYDAYHEIINLTKYKEKNKIIASIVGPICESGDKLGKDRNLPYTNEGDVMLIANAGAYVRSMSSNYNLRDMPKELLL